jgi:hypothetical protein
MMPNKLRTALIVFGTLSVILAVFLPFGEEGLWRALVPIMALIPVALIAAYWHRLPLSDVVLRAYCAVVAVVGLLFVVIQILALSSILFTTQNLLMICNTLVTGCLFFVLGNPSVRRWFTPR